MEASVVEWVLFISALAGVLGAVWYIGKLMGQGNREAEKFAEANKRLGEEVNHAAIAKDVRAGADLPDDKLHFRD